MHCNFCVYFTLKVPLRKVAFLISWGQAHGKIFLQIEIQWVSVGSKVRMAIAD